MKHKKIFLSITLALGLAQNSSHAQFNPVIQLGDLDGNNGFRLDGEAERDYSGFAVSGAGDVNGDGLDDLIIGANGTDLLNGGNVGSSYVIFGSTSGFNTTLNLSTLDGSNGFRLDGLDEFEEVGGAVSGAGDVNGDGLDDLLIGATGIDTRHSYVVLGTTSGFPATLNLDSLNGSNGFRLEGESFNDKFGSAVSAAGDVNGDGIDDLIIGAMEADANGSYSGKTYVVFGTASGFDATLNVSTLNGSNGFSLEGEAENDNFGNSVNVAGDVNGDGIDDIIIGAFRADPNDINSGSSYVIFGTTLGFEATMNMSTLDGNNGFRLDGEAESDNSGISVSTAGDINGDGLDDIIIGAFRTDSNGINSGSSYVIFGTSSGFNATLNLSTLDGSNGFRIDGETAGDTSGNDVSGAGDVNGDGLDDLIIGTTNLESNNSDTGSSYVVFGSTSEFNATLNLSTLNGRNGFRLDGEAANDNSGSAISAVGDFNGDGSDDIIIGAWGASPNGEQSGSSYVLFGKPDNIFKDGFETLNLP